jgi:hypothetical protein
MRKPSIAGMNRVPMPAVAFARAFAAFVLASACAFAADRPLYTIVDGDARVLRGVTWYQLQAGAAVENGDVVEAGEHAEVQLELPAGETLRINGPALAHAAAIVLPHARRPASEFTLLRGWFKAAVNEKAPPLLLTLPSASLRLADGVVVVHADTRLAQLFVESGHASAVATPSRGKPAARDMSEGDYWERTDERAPLVDDHIPRAFVAAMPVALRDPLPALARRFDGPMPALAAGRTINAAEAEPWLAGPTRNAFARRFARVGRADEAKTPRNGSSP